MKTDEDLQHHPEPGSSSFREERTATSSTAASSGSGVSGEYSRIQAAEEGRTADNDNEPSRSNESLPMPIFIGRNILLLCISAFVIDLSIFALWGITSCVAELFESPMSDDEWHAGVRATDPMAFLLASIFNMVFFLTYWLRAADDEDLWGWWKKAMVILLVIVGMINIMALIGGSFCAAAKAILGGH